MNIISLILGDAKQTFVSFTHLEMSLLKTYFFSFNRITKTPASLWEVKRQTASLSVGNGVTLTSLPVMPSGTFPVYSS